MLKEIYDQESVLPDLALRNISFEKTLGKDWYKGKTIFASGCGTALNAANIFGTLAAKKKILVKVVPGNEWEQIENLIDKKSILIVFSQSGETIDLIELAKKFKKAGGKVYSVLNREFSTLASISDKVFLLDSGKEVAVASTKAFTTMCIMSFKLLGFKLPKITKKDFLIKDLIDHKEIKEFVSDFKNSNSCFVLGKNLGNFVALETALKIKEVSYIHTEGFAGGELKHGVIALIEKGISVIVICDDKKYERDLENSAIQIVSRGGEVFWIGTSKKEFAKYNILLKDLGIMNIINTALVGQVLAYNFSVAKGLNPDKPRNLAKSVTVK